MNAVQEIKARNDEREWADIEAILRAIQPALKKNVERRREEEARKAQEAQRQQVVENARTALLNMALYKAGIPFQVL
ncbi:MAG: hypothetical protein Q4G01_02205 [Eubacteriales bacterium]|jgi:hypothetical protein|nr:hypothetical protein [Eubacteriales bacterium]DAM35881.1 MAG TPA: hypothetical protein [Caudoviricetes sp.]DAU63480.1 MAG TPA: hypothetical protein [Caudoviricetes sp.]